MPGGDSVDQANAVPTTSAAPLTGAAPLTSAANVRVLTPAQDMATAALSNDLVAIAERALEDRLQAEQIVAGLCRMQAALVTTATQSAMANQREAARAELERLVRRAALDAVPPVITEKATGQASRKPAAPAARKVAPPAVVQKPATKPAPAPKVIAASAPEHQVATPLTSPPSHPAGLRPVNRPAGLGDLPSTGELPGAAAPRSPAGTARGTATPLAARRPARGRRLGLAVVAMLVAVGGLGLGYMASQPDDDSVPGPIAGLPDLRPAPSGAPAPAPEAPAAEAVAPDPLQLEASEPSRVEVIEPTAVPLREQAALDEEAGGGSDASGSAGNAPVALGDDDLRIFIHYQSGSPAAALANGFSSSLALSKDPPEVELRAVDFTVATPRIRYFYTEDAAAAAALAAFLDPPTSSGNGWQVQNFTHFRPGPAAGTLEIFVPSAGG